MERLIKISDVKVVKETYYYKDKLGKEEIVTSRVEYGDNELKRDKADAQAKLTTANAIDGATYKQAQINEAQAKLDDTQELIDTMEAVVPQG